MRQRFSEGQTPVLNAAQLATQALNEYTENWAAGKRGVEAFPQRIRRHGTRQGQTIEGTRGLVNLERALIETLKNAKTLDGQPEFPQPGKTIREAQQAGEQKAQQNAANTDFDTGNQGANEPIPFFRGGGSDDESGLAIRTEAVDRIRFRMH